MLSTLLERQQETFQAMEVDLAPISHREDAGRRVNQKPFVHRRRRCVGKNARRVVHATTKAEGGWNRSLEEEIKKNSCASMPALSQWIPRSPHHDLRRVAYSQGGSINPQQRVVGDALWSQALVMNGHVYFPRNLDFCERVTAEQAQNSTPSSSKLPFHTAAPPHYRGLASRTNYKPVSPLYQAIMKEAHSLPKISELSHLEPSNSQTGGCRATHGEAIVSRDELKQQLNYAVLREQFRNFVENMRTQHAEREEYDPTKPYYTRPCVGKPQQHRPEDDEYDPPFYFSGILQK